MRVAVFLFLLVSALSAHKLYVLADDDGKSLHVKSYFTKSSTCRGCQVNVYNSKKLIDSGKTDNNGEITFKMRAKDMEIEVLASLGHKERISYSSTSEIVTEDNAITTKKMFISLSIIALIFFVLRLFKR